MPDTATHDALVVGDRRAARAGAVRPVRRVEVGRRVTVPDPALFSVAQAAAGYAPGRAERSLLSAIEAAKASSLLLPEDAGMVGAALVAARKLDRAEADP